jgi:hypothetical protein
MPHMTFGHLAPVPLHIERVVRSPMAPDQMAGMPESFTVPIDDITNAYITRRLQAAGGPEVLSIDVEELSVHYDQKASENGVAEFFGVAKIDSYVVQLTMNLTLNNEHNGAVRGRKFTVRRVINITEHASVADREKRQLEGVEAMFEDVDRTVLDILQHQYGL